MSVFKSNMWAIIWRELMNIHVGSSEPAVITGSTMSIMPINIWSTTECN